MSAEMSTGSTDKPDCFSPVLDLRLPADAAALVRVANMISDKLIELRVPEEKQHEILLAVQEALANAVVHGCKNDRSKEIRCQMERDTNGRILIVVTDPGPGFTFESVPHPKDPENLYSSHGRGVYLISELMDEVSFVNEGSEIRMLKY